MYADHKAPKLPKPKKRVRRRTPKAPSYCPERPRSRQDSSPAPVSAFHNLNKHLQSRARSLSKERAYIQYDEAFISNLQSLDTTPKPSQNSIKPRKRLHYSPSVRVSTEEDTSYAALGLKKKALKRRTSADHGPVNFRELYPDSESLIKIRQAHLNLNANT